MMLKPQLTQGRGRPARYPQPHVCPGATGRTGTGIARRSTVLPGTARRFGAG